MSGLVRGLALVCVFVVPLQVSANGWTPARTVTSYYYPAYYVPVYYLAPCQAPAQLQAAPAPQRPVATQVPAGPSNLPAQPGNAEPPLNPATPATPKNPMTPAKPAVTETRSYYNAYTVTPRITDKQSGDRCTVGFWNLGPQDMTLKIDDKTYSLARGQNLKIELGRQFVWKVEERDPRTEKIPETEAALEIVIRR